MRLGELLGTIRTCNACISITGLCDEYRDGVDLLVEEPWFKGAEDREVEEISVIGIDGYSFELCIRI